MAVKDDQCSVKFYFKQYKCVGIILLGCDAILMGVYSSQSITFHGFLCRRYWSILGLIAVLWVYGVASGPCLVDEFDAQVRRLLKDEMLTRAQITNLSTVFHDLQETLQKRWPGSQVLPLGSFVTGLASKSSDADCMVTVPSHHATSERHLVLEAAHILMKHPQLYDRVRPKVQPNRRIALLKFNYIPTQTNCDVNFISNIALQNSYMMAYYFGLDEKFLYLAAILKLWAKVQGLRDTEALASNSLNLLIIFYLQRKNIAPPFVLLQKHLIRCPINDWETSFERIRYNYPSVASLYQLLGGFFEYYSEFYFDEYVVSPLLGRPIRKREFEDIDSLPDELSLYKSYMRKPNSKPLVFNTKLCVQDAIEQRRNTADVTEDKANIFISLVKIAARMYSVMPCDRFLIELLSEHTKPQEERIRLTNILRIKDFVNATDINNKNKF